MITFSPSPLPTRLLGILICAAAFLPRVAAAQAPAPGGVPPAPPATPAPAAAAPPAAAPPAAAPPAAAPPAAAPPAAAPPPEALPPPPPPSTAPTPPAQPGEPIPPTPLDGKPLINVAIADPGPPPARTYHMHDGFYFRASMGLAYGAANINSDQSSHPDYEVNGVGLGVDIMLGGSPSVGFTVGGGLSLSGFGQDGAGGLFLLGAFVDGYPDPTGGWHLGGMLGLAGISADEDETTDDLRGGGFGLSAWIGHDFWVADEWSMGPLLRFNGAIARDPREEDAPDPFVLSAAAFEGVLMFSVLHH